MVVASLGSWHLLNRGGAVNTTGTSACNRMGHPPTFSDSLVEAGLA